MIKLDEFLTITAGEESASLSALVQDLCGRINPRQPGEPVTKATEQARKRVDDVRVRLRCAAVDTDRYATIIRGPYDREDETRLHEIEATLQEISQKLSNEQNASDQRGRGVKL